MSMGGGVSNFRVNPAVWPVTGLACPRPSPAHLAGYAPR